METVHQQGQGKTSEHFLIFLPLLVFWGSPLLLIKHDIVPVLKPHVISVFRRKPVEFL